MIDTLRNLTQNDRTFSETIDLVNKVDSFYNSAWDKLIIVGSLAFGIVGIVVPFIIQWYQKRTLELKD